MKARLILAVGLALMGCSTSEPGDDGEMLHLFSGSGNAWGMTMDRSGANLPSEHRPWRLVASYDKSDPRFRHGADREALAEVERNGFSVAIIEVTIRSPN